MSKLFEKDSKFGIMASALLANLTNTFGVYFMLYIVYAQDIFDKTGTPAFNYILGAISISTILKSIVVVLIVTPSVFALRRVIKRY